MIYIFYARIVFILKDMKEILMQEKTNLDKLSDRVSQILLEYNSLKSENEAVRNELITLKAQKELQDTEIEKLREENTMKDLEIEEIANKIESILG